MLRRVVGHATGLTRLAALQRPLPAAAQKIASPLVQSVRRCWARTDEPHLDPEVPDKNRVLQAVHRTDKITEFGQHRCKAMRKAESLSPCNTWPEVWRHSKRTKRTTPPPSKRSTKPNGAPKPLGFEPSFR